MRFIIFGQGNSYLIIQFILSVYEFNSPTKEIWLCVNPELYELNLLKYEAAERTWLI